MRGGDSSKRIAKVESVQSATHRYATSGEEIAKCYKCRGRQERRYSERFRNELISFQATAPIPARRPASNPGRLGRDAMLGCGLVGHNLRICRERFIGFQSVIIGRLSTSSAQNISLFAVLGHLTITQTQMNRLVEHATENCSVGGSALQPFSGRAKDIVR
jgi:hypothetical protein